MEVIQSFRIDHNKLLRGVYVSRVSEIGPGAQVVTFDIRMTEPNRQPVMSTGEAHAIEHLGATYLRNQSYGSQVVYWGPMGCFTGFYLIMAGHWTVDQIVKMMKDVFSFIAGFEGDVPGATPEQCGNYSDMNLPAAKARAIDYLDLLNSAGPENLNYPLL